MFELKALDGYKLGDRPLKVSFGTTKYCSHFLRGNNCPNPDCFYLHHYERQKEVSNGDSRSVFKQQNTKAIQTILGSLTTVANRVIGSEIEDYDEGFPSVMETLDYMVDSQELTTKDIEKAFQLAKSIKKDELLLPSEVSRVQSVAVDHREKDKEKDKEREKEHPKLVKSNSHSTMCTPTKLDDQAGLGASKKKQQRSQQKPQGKQKQLLLRQKQKQNKQLTSNTVGTRELKLEQKIEKLIIKEIWKKGHVESRSRFVQGVTSSREECLKLRGIVQKFLIAQN